MKLQLTVIVLVLFLSIRGTPYRDGAHMRWKSHLAEPQPPPLYISPASEDYDDSPESEEIAGRIIGGYHATTGQIYYQLRVSVFAEEQYSFCGGVLVRYHSVVFGITAAHCVWDHTQPKNTVIPSDVRVIAGEVDTKVFSRNEQYRDMHKVVMYPSFDINDTDHADDIALLFWEKPITLNRHANVIPLPETVFWPDPAIVVISGWGSTNIKTLPNGTFAVRPDLLQVLTIRTVENKLCRFFLSIHANITWKQMCVHQKGSDLGVCIGDSGGPAAGYDAATKKFHLAGILSYYFDSCGSRRFPAVFTKISAYLSWIWGEVDVYKYENGLT